MYIFEIVKPGTWLEIEDRDRSWEIEGILRSLEGQFYEANLALNMFLHTLQRDRRPHLESNGKQMLIVDLRSGGK